MTRATVVLLRRVPGDPTGEPGARIGVRTLRADRLGCGGRGQVCRPVPTEWRTRLVTVLAGRLGFGRDHVLALGAKAAGPVQVASRENVRGAVTSLAGRMHAHDLLLVVLIGHGSFDGSVAKFNLVGPNLDAGEWAALLRPVPAG